MATEHADKADEWYTAAELDTERAKDVAKHPYKPLPRGDHEITVRLCSDCDTWHASDDSLLYNEATKRDWEAQLATERLRIAELEAQVRQLREALTTKEDLLRRLEKWLREIAAALAEPSNQSEAAK